MLPAHAQLCVLSYEHDWCLHDINVTERADRTAFDPPPSFALVRKTSTDFVRCLRSFTSAHFMLWFACVCRRGRGVCCGPDRVHPKPQRTRARARMSRQAGACMRAADRLSTVSVKLALQSILRGRTADFRVVLLHERASATAHRHHPVVADEPHQCGGGRLEGMLARVLSACVRVWANACACVRACARSLVCVGRSSVGSDQLKRRGRVVCRGAPESDRTLHAVSHQRKAPLFIRALLPAAHCGRQRRGSYRR